MEIEQTKKETRRQQDHYDLKIKELKSIKSNVEIKEEVARRGYETLKEVVDKMREE